jgi:DeoR/GlpR family transcriptional regulator of sugar metabolism
VATEPVMPIEPERPALLAPTLRRRDMLRRIQREGGGTVGELARAYSVSPVTIHRDLQVLVDEGTVERLRGGVRPLVGPEGDRERDFDRRRRQAGEAKRIIAACAATLVKGGSTIFLDASTTCLALARELERMGPPQITLVTNSPAIAFELHSSAIHLILTPGEVDQNMVLVGGRWTVEFLGELNLETAFISGAGLTLDNGLTTAQRSIADVLRAASSAAQETVALVDATKFGTHSLLTIAPVQEIDRLIVDQAVDLELLAAYERAGVRVTVARAGVSQWAEDGEEPTATDVSGGSE